MSREMTNKEVITKYVEKDNNYFICEDIQEGVVAIEVSLDWWNSEYKEEVPKTETKGGAE